MNKSIKKSLFITIILMNIFFFNTYKVNAKVTECYYVLPNSNIYMNGTNSIRNVYQIANIENKKPNSDKRMYFSVKIKENGEITGNDWSLNSSITGIAGFNLDVCPKYISFELTGNHVFNADGDEKYINYIKNYYDSKIKLLDNHIFRFDNGNLPSAPKYVPLYYYKTESGGDKKCYLDENIGKKQDSYCEVQYDGKNPIKEYIDITTLNYSNLSTYFFEDLKSKCNIKNLSQNERNNIYNAVVRVTKGEEISGDNCILSARRLGLLSAASYYYSEAITSGGAGNDGFKSYKKYYNKLLENTKTTAKNSSVQIDSGFLSLADIKSSSDSTGVGILDAYVNLDELQSELNNMNETENNICEYSSSDANKCSNAVNACRNGDSPTSENIRTCYNERGDTPIGLVDTCDNLLATCMEESQGITDAKSALQNLIMERQNVSNQISNAENILNNAKKSISINEDQSNPLSMINGSIDSSVNFECSDISFLRFIWLIMIIAAPILTIVFGVLDFTQAVMAGDEQKMNKLKSKFIKRLAALALFIILPIIIKTIVNISDNDSVRSIKMAKCIVNGEE